VILFQREKLNYVNEVPLSEIQPCVISMGIGVQEKMSCYCSIEFLFSYKNTLHCISLC
jgi:hypothetical protein